MAQMVHNHNPQETLTDLYMQVRNRAALARAKPAQLRAARSALKDSYRALTKAARGGAEGQAHEIAIRAILTELTRRAN